MKCQYCDVVQVALIDDINRKPFGKIVRKCSACGRMWGINRSDRAPYEIKEDPRLAFSDDPRQGGPQ